MLNRRESRGSHYREDYPVMDTTYNKRLKFPLRIIFLYVINKKELLQNS